MEKISILSLSLILVSTYSVSAALPGMVEYFKDYSRTEVEQLISIPSFAIMIMVLLNTKLSVWIRERVSITLGLLLLVAGGSAPMFIRQYELMFAARVLMGIGIGLINTYAITMINERYEGRERAELLGIRGSAEVLGNAVLTLIAGKLLLHGWSKAFAVYLAGLPVLFLYLTFVPERSRRSPKERAERSPLGRRTERSSLGEMAACPSIDEGAERRDFGEEAKSQSVRESTVHQSRGKSDISFLLGCGLMGSMMICMNSGITMRIPGLVLERGLGTEGDASVVLSVMLVAGMVGGLGFGRLTELLGRRMMAVLMLVLGAGLAIISNAGTIWMLGAGAAAAGMADSLLVTVQFHRVSTRLPEGRMTFGTTCVLVGCNLGASMSPHILRLIDSFGGKSGTVFLVFAVFALLLGAVFSGWMAKERI